MSLFGNAMFAAVLVGALCGVVGALVVLRQRAFFTVALTHATFPGGVLAAIFGVHMALGGMIMGIALVALMVVIGKLHRQGKEVAAGIVLSFGYALGTFLHSINPGLQTKIDSFLTGTILGIGSDSILLIAIMLGVSVIAVLLWWQPLLFSTFDARGYVASGAVGWRVEALTLALIVGTVVVTMPAIGSILAIALIAAPAAAARLLVRNVMWIIPVSVVLGVSAAAAGLLASKWWSLSAGGAIALAATAVYVIAVCLHAMGIGRVRTQVANTNANVVAA